MVKTLDLHPIFTKYFTNRQTVLMPAVNGLNKDIVKCVAQSRSQVTTISLYPVAYLSNWPNYE